MSSKCKAFLLNDKIKILQNFDKCTSLKKVEVAKKINIPLPTVKTIVYNRMEIEDMSAARGNSGC